jgi:hypothetical protein
MNWAVVLCNLSYLGGRDRETSWDKKIPFSTHRWAWWYTAVVTAIWEAIGRRIVV